MSSLLRPARRSMLRASASRASGSRSLHHLPPMPRQLASERACDPLFPSRTLDLLWNKWHKGLLEKLNDQVRGTEWEHRSIVETVIGLAQEPEKAIAFNLASQALNNSFFLSGLRPKPLEAGQVWNQLPPSKPPKELSDAIRENFDSLPAFKDAFSATVMGMAGSGWVWLVRDMNGKLGIVPTFAAGTVLVQNRQQRALSGAEPSYTEEDLAKQEQRREAAALSGGAASSAPASTYYGGGDDPVASTGGRKETSASLRTLGNELFPLLCISVHEHAWLPDYGMHGKEEYLSRFWESVDWARAGRLFQEYNNALVPAF